MTLSIVIVNYNVKYFLEQALYSVQKAVKNIDADIWVVDNNSVDGSCEMVKQKFPEVKLIENKVNVGFSTANNQAIAESNAEYVLLLNPDTVVEEDTFEKCIDFMEKHPDAGALGAKMIDGTGTFLPESKRGFPSPLTSLFKITGLYRFFPKSETINAYYMGHLSDDENNEVDVLAGAFMFMRKDVLEKIGYLDETFFMYGEDIDLSYRVQLGGYKNYYLADTRIIHYKGESTKRGSLNYVKMFYQAMIIFAKKHFSSRNASIYVFCINAAIYLRAIVAMVQNVFKSILIPMIDVILLFVGMYFLQDFWGENIKNAENYYPKEFMIINVPIYISLWLGAVFFNGGYDKPIKLSRIIRGILMGTIGIAAVYGFLPEVYRFSRMLIPLGAIWAIIGMFSFRYLLSILGWNGLKSRGNQTLKTIVVGGFGEFRRVRELMSQFNIPTNMIGFVKDNPESEQQNDLFLGNVRQLDELVNIYKIEEVIFCSKDIPANEVMEWMTKLGVNIQYKTVPEDGLSIVGSHQRDGVGEMYVVDVRFDILTTLNQRNKRVLDVLTTLGFLLFSPILIWKQQNKFQFLKDSILALIGKKSWIGYDAEVDNTKLPKIKQGIFTPTMQFNTTNLDQNTIHRLNLLYAKDYKIGTDFSIILKQVLGIGR